MSDGRSDRLGRLGLAGGALGWLTLVALEVGQLWAYEGLGLVSQRAAQRALLSLGPLGLGWAAVLGGSVGPAGLGLVAGTLARALSVGAFAAGLVLLPSMVTGLLRAGGAGPITQGHLLLMLVPQALAFAAAAWLARTHRPEVGLARRKALALLATAGIASFLLNLIFATTGPRVCYRTEAHAVSDLRGILSAAEAYREQIGPLDAPECLVMPERCSGDGSWTGRSFMDASLLEPVRCGYRFTFFLERRPKAPLPSSREGTVHDETQPGFAVTAAPVQAGRTGTQSFCLDASGGVRYSADGREIVPMQGRCPETLELLAVR
jgi:hypothetical protein